MRQVLRQCRHYFVYAALFSLFLNVLQLTVPLYMLQVFDRVLTSRSPETLAMLSLVTLGALLVFALLDWLRTQLLSAAGIALDGLLGPVVLASLFREAARPDSLAYRDGLRDLAVLRGFLCNGPVIALFDLPWMPLYLGVIFIFHPGLGLIATFGAVALALLGLINERLTRAPMGRMSQAARQAAHSIDASLRNAEAIQALGMADALLHRWQRANDLVIDALVAGNRPAHALTALTKLLRLLIQVAMLAAGAWLVIDQQVTSGVMMTGTLILARALAPIEAAIASWRAFADARGAYRRLDPWLTANARRREAEIALPAPTGRLSVEQAVFALPGMERPILRGISFHIQAGEALGILGPSGSGKSTLARLLTGIWPASAGGVRLDAADLSRWPRDQLGPHLGYLPQDVELFAGTVAENIARMATPDSAAVVRAAQRAHAHELILRLPRGYETDIGEAGALLSGGQRQRIALARALYGDPRLLVLDEPNASLDSAGEEALAQCLEQLRADAVTVVVISHRPALLKQMDKLLVLKDGLIDMFGPCAEVLARYARPAPGAAAIPPQLVRGGRSA